MPDDPMPSFRYHPDPIATGSVASSPQVCVVCGLARGLVYVGPVYCVERGVSGVCPWCIANGAAADQFDAQFTDLWGAPPDLPSSVTDEILRRTPGYLSWQQPHWLYHCGDAAAFLGRVGSGELRPYPDAIEMLLHENDEYGWTQDQSRDYVESLLRDGDATGYLFRCLHCGRHLAYSDTL